MTAYWLTAIFTTRLLWATHLQSIHAKLLYRCGILALCFSLKTKNNFRHIFLLIELLAHISGTFPCLASLVIAVVPKCLHFENNLVSNTVMSLLFSMACMKFSMIGKQHYKTRFSSMWEPWPISLSKQILTGTCVKVNFSVWVKRVPLVSTSPPVEAPPNDCSSSARSDVERVAPCVSGRGWAAALSCSSIRFCSRAFFLDRYSWRDKITGVQRL